VVASQHLAVGIPAGSINLNKQDPSVTTTANVVVSVLKGEITLTPHAPSVGFAISIGVPKGQITLTKLNPAIENRRKKDLTTICANEVRTYLKNLFYPTATERIYDLQQIKNQRVMVMPLKRTVVRYTRCDNKRTHYIEISVQKQGLESQDVTLEQLQQLLIGRNFPNYVCTAITTEEIVEQQRAKGNTYLGKFIAEFVSV
jgi:hypothetical protein